MLKEKTENVKIVNKWKEQPWCDTIKIFDENERQSKEEKRERDKVEGKTAH